MNGLEDISGSTYARTYGRDSLGLQRLRETKKLTNSKELIMIKMQNTSIFGILGQNSQFLTFLAKMGKMGSFSNERLEHFFHLSGF